LLQNIGLPLLDRYLILTFVPFFNLIVGSMPYDKLDCQGCPPRVSQWSG
jgi:hypothetical protein